MAYGGAKARELRFLNILVTLAKRKSFILKFVLVAVTGAVATVLLLPDAYTANAKAISSVKSFPTYLMTTTLPTIPANAEFAAPDLQVAILRSDTVADRLIDRFSLLNVYEAGIKEKARRILANRTEITAGKDNVISISVTDRSPQRAADLANGYLEEFERLAKGLTAEEAYKKKKFFEREAKAAREALAAAETAFRQTQEKTHLVLLDQQTKFLIRASALLRAQVRLQELRLQSMDSFATPENPRRVLVERELAALREQQSKFELGSNQQSGIEIPLTDIPGRGLEYWRAAREVQYCDAVFNLLSKEYETSKLDEAQAEGNTQPVVQVMDKAAVPERKSFPPRFLLVASAMLLSLFLSVWAALLQEKRERRRRGNPPHAVPLFTFYLGEKRAIAPKTRSKSA